MGAPVLGAPPQAPVLLLPGASQAPVQAVPVPAGFAGQLARPVFTLASAGPGEHTLTVAVNPENLGPVTVQAHISASGVRVELFAASSDGRDVLRQILPDLKRDLAGSGLNATLDLSSGGQPGGGGQGSRDEFMNRRPAVAYPAATEGRQSPTNSQASSVTPGLRGSGGTLDVMA
jgi:flagellar hook-length control protein FliK